MKIGVTKAARNFADCISRVRYENVTFVLLRHGKIVANLGPGSKKVCNGRDLAAALTKIDLPKIEARAWVRELRSARKA